VKSLEGLYLKSFDATRIRINKKVKVYYEELTTYQQANLTNAEVYVPLVIAEPIQEAIPIPCGENPFINYQYPEASVELVEEKYHEDTNNNNNNNVKVIKLN